MTSLRSPRRRQLFAAAALAPAATLAATPQRPVAPGTTTLTYDSPWLHIAPQCIYWATRFAAECYGHQTLYITENGCGYNDEPVVNGEVLDLHRRDFLRNHLREAHRAIADGVPLKGYFLWSFIDNYEWEDGYQRRFGIVHCDYETLVRTPKLSARYYAEVVKAHRIL